MGPALNSAAGMNAYILADRGTWLSFKNRADLTIMLEGDKRLFNPYGIILVNPAKHPSVKKAEGQAFIDWVISPEGQNAIAGLQRSAVSSCSFRMRKGRWAAIAD
jgi:tungstate transport system substrate-binding protein